MVAGNVLGGWLSDRLGSGWVFALGSLVAIAGIGCFALLRGPQDLPLLLLYTAAGFGFGMRIALLSRQQGLQLLHPRVEVLEHSQSGRRGNFDRDFARW